tara:strand:+ start:573 stop:1076 length:504 start_codon:yes stop_codon:yes gene_type:complete
MKNPADAILEIKRLILLFIVALLISGVTAFFLETELNFIVDHFSFGHVINNWLSRVYRAIVQINIEHPFLSYGFDWLAFGHIIISLFFIEVYKKPVENRWVLRYGMYACVLIFPVAFVAGYFRQIPILWQLIDCAFGVFGFALLYAIHYKIENFKKSINYSSSYNYG